MFQIYLIGMFCTKDDFRDLSVLHRSPIVVSGRILEVPVYVRPTGPFQLDFAKSLRPVMGFMTLKKLIFLSSKHSTHREFCRGDISCVWRNLNGFLKKDAKGCRRAIREKERLVGGQ